MQACLVHMVMDFELLEMPFLLAAGGAWDERIKLHTASVAYHAMLSLHAALARPGRSGCRFRQGRGREGREKDGNVKAGEAGEVEGVESSEAGIAEGASKPSQVNLDGSPIWLLRSLQQLPSRHASFACQLFYLASDLFGSEQLLVAIGTSKGAMLPVLQRTSARKVESYHVKRLTIGHGKNAYLNTVLQRIPKVVPYDRLGDTVKTIAALQAAKALQQFKLLYTIVEGPLSNSGGSIATFVRPPVSLSVEDQKFNLDFSNVAPPPYAP
eukprot:SM000016S01881  [mRNA]  locus=s16:283178:286876:+ [translate_table: standard]